MALHLAAHTLSDEPRSPVTNVHLNADATLFASSTVEGWVIYQTNPLQVVSRKDLADSSLSICVPLERTNLVFLVGGPPTPLYPPNKVVLYDVKANRAVAELEFREEVRGLAARRDRLVVALRRRVIVFVLGHGQAGIWREGTYETTDNPKGLVSLASAAGSSVLAFPGRQPGQVQIVRLPALDPTLPAMPPPPSHDPTSAPYPAVSVLLAHTSALAAISVTPDGRLLASASKQGTLVRIWDTQTSRLVKELRRGTDSAEIFSLSLRADGGAVAVSSDKGTVHVWDLHRHKKDAEKQLSMLKPYLPKYFSSEWSHSQFRLPAPASPPSRLPAGTSTATSAPTVEDDVCICAWIDVPPDDGQNERSAPSSDFRSSQLVAITRSGGWFRIAFDSEPMSNADLKGKGRASEQRSGPRIGAKALEGVIGLDKDSTSDCRVVEYRRFGQKDGW
ncbi:WD40 repeat-like protein [Rhodotorula sp. JG-1b]|nr:WD40 repeat-like protein [Rhodotorula sp. JG-1b]